MQLFLTWHSARMAAKHSRRAESSSTRGTAPLAKKSATRFAIKDMCRHSQLVLMPNSSSLAIRRVPLGCGDRIRRSTGDPMQHKGTVLGVAFSKDGHHVATASADNTARVWDAATGKPIGEPFRHDDSVYDVAFQPRWQTAANFLRRSLDANLAPGDGGGQKRLIVFGQEGNPYLQAMKVSRDGRLILTSISKQISPGPGQRPSLPMSCRSGRLPREKLLPDRFTPKCTNSPVLAIAPNNRVFLAATDDAVQTWDVHTGKPLGSPMKHLGVDNASFIQNGAKVITRANDHSGSRLGRWCSRAPRRSPYAN